MKKSIYLAIRNRTFRILLVLFWLLSLSSFRISNIPIEEKYPSYLVGTMEKTSNKLPGKTSNPGNAKPGKISRSNRKSVYSGSDPIHFVFSSNKKKVGIGEEVELTITAHYMAIHPGLLTVFPGSNAFSLKVLVPNGFIQTGGDYVDLIGTELSFYRKTATYTLKGKFISATEDDSFRLLRSHKDAGVDSKFVEKGTLKVHCQNSVETNTIAGSSKEFRLAASEVVCTPFSEVCSGNSQEVRHQSITVTQAGTYLLALNYRSHEKTAYGIVRIDGVAQNVTFAMTGSYQNQPVGNVVLSAGTHTIGLSSGSAGGLVCFNNICLTSTTPNCDYTPSASSSNINPGCGTAITLNTTCIGADCDGVSYNWSTGQNGQSISTTAPGSNGNVTYTVTASKNGCSKTAQTTVTVSGCGGSGNYSVSLEAEDASGTGTIQNDPGASNNKTRWSYSSSSDYLDYTLSGTNAVPSSGSYTIILSFKSISASTGSIIVNGHSQSFSLPSTEGGGSTYTSTITLVSGSNTIRIQGNSGRFAQDRIQIIGNTSPNCNYAPSATASKVNPNCGEAITLNSICNGSDCDGVSYNWSTGQNGQLISTSVPSSNGTVNYTVTASKNGCSKTAQITVTVNGCGSGSLTGCYIISSKKTGQLLQSLPSDVVEQRPAANQSNQIWKVENIGSNQYKFTNQDGSNKGVQVNAANQGELIRVGAYTTAELQKWTLQSDNNGSYRISASNGITWDMRNYGVDPQLQLWGNVTDAFADQRLFRFESVGCPTAPSTTGSCTSLRNADSPANLTSGLTYRYYQSIANNDWCTATGLTSQAAINSGSVTTISLTPRQRNDHFGFEFTGYIQVPADGQYTFFLSSDDDSRLAIGGQLIVTHSGCHGIATAGQEPSGIICLRAGYHPIQILYSQGNEGLGLQAFWQGPNIPKQEIPAGALFHNETPGTSCNFVISASAPSTAGCTSAITLNAICLGSECDGISYSWSTGQNSQTVNTSAPGSNGTVNYIVTASKSGCPNQTATTTLTVSNCTTLYQDMGRAGTRRDQFDVAKSGAQNGTIGITDISNYSVNGYNTLYFVNDVFVGGTLSNYQLPVNAKYVVDKLITKSNITSGYQRVDDLWKQNSQDSQWIKSWHQQIIDTYDEGTPISDQTIGGGKGKLLPLYESWFIRSNNWNSEALKSTPPLALPIGKVFGGDPLDATATLDDYHSHGWNLIHRTQINGQNVPVNERLIMPNGHDFNQGLLNSTASNKSYSNGNPTYEQGVAAQDYAGADGFGWLIDQVGEGENYVYGTSDGYLAYHERFKQRSPASHTFGNYSSNSFRYRAFSYNFQPEGGGARNPLNFNNYLRPYQSQEQARIGTNGNTDPFYSNHGGKSLSSVGVEQLINYYPLDINEVDGIYVKLHEMDIMLKQDPGNKPIGYFWPLRENPSKNNSIGGDASSGQNSYEWEHETTNPAGIVRQKSHSTSSLISAEVFGFDAMTRGKGAVYFHNRPLTGNDRNKIGISALYGATWQPKPGSPSDFPFISLDDQGVSPPSPLVGFDASYQGRIKAQRALDWLGTTIPNWEYATYSINGSTRPAPTDGSAILYHASDYKPMAMILSNGSKKVVWAFDPYCQPNAVQTMSVNLNDGTSIDIVLKGNALHVILIN